MLINRIINTAQSTNQMQQIAIIIKCFMRVRITKYYTNYLTN